MPYDQIQPVGPVLDHMVPVSALLGLALGLYGADFKVAAGVGASWAFLSNWQSPPPFPATHPMNPVVDAVTVLAIWAAVRQA